MYSMFWLHQTTYTSLLTFPHCCIALLSDVLQLALVKEQIMHIFFPEPVVKHLVAHQVPFSLCSDHFLFHTFPIIFPWLYFQSYSLIP